MIICIPTSGNAGIEEQVYGHFGTCRYLVLYNTENEEIEILEHKSESHGTGICTPFAFIEGKNVDVILTQGMGRRALDILYASGAKAFYLEGDTVKEAVGKYLAGELKEITPENSCRGHV